MPRGIRAALSIVELERLLNSQRSAVNKLLKRRGVIQRKLDGIDREITKLGGGSGGGGGTRNSISLPTAMEAALKKHGTMRVGDIVDAVVASGYRSKSANFRGIVNQTLIKDKRFTSTGRGVYQLKK
jgi:hypothetical protein